MAGDQGTRDSSPSPIAEHGVMKKALALQGSETKLLFLLVLIYGQGQAIENLKSGILV